MFSREGVEPARAAADAIAPEAVVVSTPAERPAGWPDWAAPEPQSDLTIALDRRFNPVTEREEFRLLRRIGYHDDAPGIGVGQILIPADLENWTTSLSSVPPLLTWLVPKTQAHLLPAILHDGLVGTKRGPASYIAEREINRDEADRIFRDAMAKTGTGLIRRWLIWAALTVATIHHGRHVDWTRIQKWHYRIALWLTLSVIVALGIWSTLDLLGARGVPSVPWIPEPPTQGLIGGVSGTIVIPLILCTAWGRFRIAGWIMGSLVALIVPAAIPIALIGGICVLVVGLERSPAWLAKAVTAVFLATALAAFVASWWTA